MTQQLRPSNSVTRILGSRLYEPDRVSDQRLKYPSISRQKNSSIHLTNLESQRNRYNSLSEKSIRLRKVEERNAEIERQNRMLLQKLRSVKSKNPYLSEKKLAMEDQDENMVRSTHIDKKLKLPSLSRQNTPSRISDSTRSNELKSLHNIKGYQNEKLNSIIQDRQMLTEKYLNGSPNKKKTLINDRQLGMVLTEKGWETRALEIDLNKRAQEKKKEEEKISKIENIRKNIIGFNTEYISPFNFQLESVYVDHTATSRPYRTVQTMVEYIKTFIANPHTEFSHYGKFSTDMMHWAELSLLKSFSANPEVYVALPTGSGSTGAIEKAMKILKQDQTPQTKPDVFLSPYEHHSNILPWVQFYESINLLAYDEDKQELDMEKLSLQLSSWERDHLIVSVSAASNVTSQVTDLESLNQVIKTLRQSNKNIIFAVDCAAYCCHHQLNLQTLDEIDFVFLSPHKNLGGAESCGILVARKSVIKGAKPTFPGGGTVAFVKGYSKEDVLYDADVFNREIPGTPPFLGFYRAALSFELLKNDIGYDFIHEREKANTELFMKLINEQNDAFIKEKIPSSIVVYGSHDFSKRANVITMNIICDNEIMQHSFLSLILADTFGIQLRSGCFCAGPFGIQLLKVEQQAADKMQSILSVGILKQKPGYLRLDLTFYLEAFEIEYLAYAIGMTARYCKNMLMVYTICNDGEIKRHKLFKDTFGGMYGLENRYLAEEIVKRHIETDEERHRNRRVKLDQQLNQGKGILMDPLRFLKAQMNKEVVRNY